MRKIFVLLVAIFIPFTPVFVGNQDIESIEKLLSLAQQEKESLEVEWIACEQELTKKLKSLDGDKIAQQELLALTQETQKKIEPEIEKLEILIEELESKKVPQLLHPRQRVQGKVQPPQANASRPTRVSLKRKPGHQRMQSQRVQQKQEQRVTKKNRLQAKPVPIIPAWPNIYR